MALAEELRAGEDFEHRVGEEEDDDHVDDHCEAEGEREAAHRADGQDVEDDRGEHVHALGGVDRALRPVPADFDGREQVPAAAQLVSHTFEVDDERVRGHADADDDTGETGQRQSVAVSPRRQQQKKIGEHTDDHEARDRDEAEHPILQERVHDDEDEPGEPGEQTDREVVRTQRR